MDNFKFASEHSFVTVMLSFADVHSLLRGAYDLTRLSNAPIKEGEDPTRYSNRQVALRIAAGILRQDAEQEMDRLVVHWQDYRQFLKEKLG